MLSGQRFLTTMKAKIMKNLLITGSEGFIGKNLTVLLPKITALNLFSPSMSELDLKDSEGVYSYVKSNNIDFIIHCASSPLVGKSYSSEALEENLRMFFNLERSLPESGKMFSLCSGSVYDRRYWHHKMSETYFDTNVPTDSHSYSKYIISKYVQQTRKKIFILRLFGVYGPGEDYKYKFISNCVVKALHDLDINIISNNIFHYLWVDDLARLIVELANNFEFLPAEINIVPDTEVQLLKIAQAVIKLTGSKSVVSVISDKVLFYTGDNSVLKTVVTDFEFTDLDVGIGLLIKYFNKTKQTLDLEDIKKDDYLVQAKKISEITIL
jgi:UDP-glucose 4-epimerase